MTVQDHNITSEEICKKINGFVIQFEDELEEMRKQLLEHEADNATKGDGTIFVGSSFCHDFSDGTCTSIFELASSKHQERNIKVYTIFHENDLRIMQDEPDITAAYRVERNRDSGEIRITNILSPNTVYEYCDAVHNGMFSRAEQAFITKCFKQYDCGDAQPFASHLFSDEPTGLTIFMTDCTTDGDRLWRGHRCRAKITAWRDSLAYRQMVILFSCKYGESRIHLSEIDGRDETGTVWSWQPRR